MNDATGTGSATIYFLGDKVDADGPDRKAERLLVRRVLAGERRAFEQIVEANKSRMFTVARTVLGRHHTADEFPRH